MKKKTILIHFLQSAFNSIIVEYSILDFKLSYRYINIKGKEYYYIKCIIKNERNSNYIFKWPWKCMGVLNYWTRIFSIYFDEPFLVFFALICKCNWKIFFLYKHIHKIGFTLIKRFTTQIYNYLCRNVWTQFKGSQNG